MENNFKQFKFSNDDEVICEVLEWNDDNNSAIIVRNVMRVVQVEDFEKGIRFYAFRPWMVFNDSPSELHTINSDHIIAEINPSKTILKHYFNSLSELKEQLENRNRTIVSLDDIADKMGDMDEDEFDEYLHKLSLMHSGESDSDMPENVIRFKPKGTFH